MGKLTQTIQAKLSSTIHSKSQSLYKNCDCILLNWKGIILLIRQTAGNKKKKKKCLELRKRTIIHQNNAGQF